ncbi:MAG: peptidoglycan-binding domain-containing protein [Acetobacteraceae bacterium]
MLQERGLYAGAIDGIAGKLTERGLRTFQDRHGLPETGELTRATFARLTRGDGGAASASEASLTGR